MKNAKESKEFFDADFPLKEQFPRIFEVAFREISTKPKPSVRMTIDDHQIGDVITDNSYSNDHYRFHDIFHFSYVAILGWSPCVRKMLKRKRKSSPRVDEVEDGARAIITEEAISLLIFNYARQNNLFTKNSDIDPLLLSTIETLAADFEVRERGRDEWIKAILKGYEAFRNLVKYKSGTVRIDMLERELLYINC
jgi:MazG C-terminal domain